MFAVPSPSDFMADAAPLEDLVVFYDALGPVSSKEDLSVAGEGHITALDWRIRRTTLVT